MVPVPLTSEDQVSSERVIQPLQGAVAQFIDGIRQHPVASAPVPQIFPPASPVSPAPHLPPFTLPAGVSLHSPSGLAFPPAPTYVGPTPVLPLSPRNPSLLSGYDVFRSSSAPVHAMCGVHPTNPHPDSVSPDGFAVSVPQVHHWRSGSI